MVKISLRNHFQTSMSCWLVANKVPNFTSLTNSGGLYYIVNIINAWFDTNEKQQGVITKVWEPSIPSLNNQLR